MRLFVGFIAGLLNEFSRYLESSENIDLLADGVGLFQYRFLPGQRPSLLVRHWVDWAAHLAAHRAALAARPSVA